MNSLKLQDLAKQHETALKSERKQSETMHLSEKQAIEIKLKSEQKAVESVRAELQSKIKEATDLKKQVE